MASSAAAYKRILNLLDKWPVDKTKTGRDLGEYLRDSINKAYKQNKFEADPKYWDRQYLSLQKLLNNEHCKQNPRNLKSSSTGLTAEQCNIALSNEFLKELENENLPFYKRLFSFRTKSD